MLYISVHVHVGILCVTQYRVLYSWPNFLKIASGKVEPMPYKSGASPTRVKGAAQPAFFVLLVGQHTVQMHTCIHCILLRGKFTYMYLYMYYLKEN